MFDCFLNRSWLNFEFSVSFRFCVCIQKSSKFYVKRIISKSFFDAAIVFVVKINYVMIFVADGSYLEHEIGNQENNLILIQIHL